MKESRAPSAPVMLHRIPCVRARRGWPGADGGYLGRHNFARSVCLGSSVWNRCNGSQRIYSVPREKAHRLTRAGDDIALTDEEIAECREYAEQCFASRIRSVKRQKLSKYKLERRLAEIQ